MKIISAQQFREADKHTIQNEPIASIDLMERAAKACACRIAEITSPQTTYSVFCGKGNNGGDGLAIARLLSEMKRKVKVFIVNHSENESKDFTANFQRLEKLNFANIHKINSAKEINLNENTFIIDALVGTGINKAVDGLLAEVIDFINDSKLLVISIDVPSGLSCDTKPNHKHIIRAGKTLTFQRPKYTFLFADFYPYVGNFEVVDIGLNEKFIEEQNSTNFIVTRKNIAHLLIHREQIAHKGTYGHALLLAGSKGKIGAALLGAKACLRSGAGLLTTHLPACGYTILQTALPEAMVSIDATEDYISACPKTENYSAIAIGPGIGTDKATEQSLKVLIQECTVPLVLDADALSILAQNKTWLSFVAPNTILTPHPKEFDRLCGAHTSDFERLETCKDFAFKHKIIVVLKGAHTAVVTPDKKVFFNSTGNPALAKGGSGDALTGIILGLLARGYEPIHACMIATHIHGYAADLYVKKFSEESMLASDLIELLPVAFYFF